MEYLSKQILLLVCGLLIHISSLTAQTTVQLGEQCDCNAGRGPWTNTNNTAATTTSSTIRFLGQRVGVGVNPLSALQLRNNTGTDNSAGTSSFSSFTDYQLLLYQGGNAVSSYGLGIEAGTFALNSNGSFDWNIKGNDRMTLTSTGLGIGTNPVAALQLKNNTGADNSAGTSSFDAFSNYQLLLYQSGSARSSYGIGVEAGTLAFNSNGEYDWNINGNDRMTLTNIGLGVGIRPEAALHLKNNTGVDNSAGTSSFSSFGDYQLLLYRGGNAISSYGIGVEAGTLAFNSNGEYDWNIKGNDRMTLTNGGLSVKGNITATGTITPDYVFEQYYDGNSTRKPDYTILDLAAVKAYTQAHKHLPGVPSAADIEAQGGIILNRQSEIQLEKIEELFLHTIEQAEEIKSLKGLVKELQTALGTAQDKNETLEERLAVIEALLKE